MTIVITLGNIIIATTDITTDKDTSKTLNYTKAVGSRLHGRKLLKFFENSCEFV